MPVTDRLDWRQLKPVQFEALLYELLPELGFKNVDWRKGTPKDSTSPDYGRDLEAEFPREDPDGDLHAERWFVQAKHHEAALSPSDFSDALDWAESERPDVLLIAGSHLSNPSKEHIKKYEQNNRPAFRIRVWEQPKIEGLLSKHPNLIRKYFSEQDPVAGMWENAFQDFHNHGVLLDSDRLAILFESRVKLGFLDSGRYDHLYLVLLSEYALEVRPQRDWIAQLRTKDVAALIPVAIVNLTHHFTPALENTRRWASMGMRTVFNVLPALAAELLSRGHSPRKTAELLWSPQKFLVTQSPEEDKKSARAFRHFLMRLVLRPLILEGSRRCAQTCGGVEVKETGNGVGIGSLANVSCKLGLYIDDGDESTSTQDISLCPARLLAILIRGMPPDDEAAVTRRELDKVLRCMSLILVRGSRLLQEPTSTFEMTALPFD